MLFEGWGTRGPPERHSHPTGLQTSQDARFYALSARFEPFSNKGQTLVVQFTVKHEQNIDCGGGYVKLFPGSLDQKDMHGDSEYNIMFGEGGGQPVRSSACWTVGVD